MRRRCRGFRHASPCGWRRTVPVLDILSRASMMKGLTMGREAFDGFVAGVNFILFNVMPIAFSEIYDWIKDWQVLIAAVLIIAAGRTWVNALTRGHLHICLLYTSDAADDLLCV